MKPLYSIVMYKDDSKVIIDFEEYLLEVCKLCLVYICSAMRLPICKMTKFSFLCGLPTEVVGRHMILYGFTGDIASTI